MVALMKILSVVAGYLAPCFIMASPILSYSDQAMAMHRNKSSAGFSLDIPLIMLVASFFRIFYYPGARFDTSLLIQSLIMVIMQLLLLKIALDHRPSPATKGGDAGLPFAAPQETIMGMRRPWNFWQWRSPKPYWSFILYLFIALVVGELVVAHFPPAYNVYYVTIGYVGLGVEATLPLPQIIANSQSKSCRGFRLSVLLNWLAGDAMKMFWFFTATTEIPWAFKCCGLFQAFCDSFLGVQYLIYGEGTVVVKGHPVPEGTWPGAYKPGMQMPEHGHMRRSSTPTRRTNGYSEKDID